MGAGVGVVVRHHLAGHSQHLLCLVVVQDARQGGLHRLVDQRGSRIGRQHTHVGQPGKKDLQRR